MSFSENVCIFSDAAEVYQDLFCSQFIYETDSEHLGDNRTYSAFCCHLVTEGEAVLHTPFGSWPVKTGDLFFVFPSVSFTLEQKSVFKYLYISFLGKHSFHLLESLDITRSTPVREAFGELLPIWTNAFGKCNPKNLSFMAKGILYYTFALLQQPAVPLAGDNDVPDNIVIRIRDAIEQDYAKADLSLEYLCAVHHYSTKYVSRKFTDMMGVSFSEHLTACRIRHACTLLSQTDLSIREVAASVGYRDALYFSKAFKKIMLLSPREYRADNKSL